MRRWTHFIIKIIIIKSCFSKIKIKVASRCSVKMMIDNSFFIIGFSLMVELSVELSSSVNYPDKTLFQSSRSLFHVDDFLWLVKMLSVYRSLFIYLFILLFLLQAVKYPKNSYVFVQDVLGKKINNPLVQQYKQRCVYLWIEVFD